MSLTWRLVLLVWPSFSLDTYIRLGIDAGQVALGAIEATFRLSTALELAPPTAKT